ncbi:hypothetical protein CR513_53998, partial [Mucuna pruriens]
MALTRERSVGKAFANIPTNTEVQIVLMLLLFSQVTNAWDWNCLGATKYTLSFENHMADDILGYDMTTNELEIECWNTNKRLTLKPNASVTFCGGWILDPYVLCFAALSNSPWRHHFLGLMHECKKEKICQ